ncbi:MAG: SCO family protein [Halioglobus sp.]|nr:SCO family protein [Halioglobus sp.]
MSPRARMLAGFTLANLAILLAAFLLYSNRSAAPPLIQGVLLPEARAVADFSLLSHHNEPFTNADLLGRWHLVSYGFTTCPDICPTTLSRLVNVSRELEKRGHSDLNVLFYTVDHRRDTVAQMASYVPYFHPDYIGLTHVDDAANNHLPFEQSLGIVAQLIPNFSADAAGDPNDYQVSHGVTLFLINPEGKLQAIFEPGRADPGMPDFEPERVLEDYLAIRDYLG